MPEELPGRVPHLPASRWAEIKLLAIDVDGVLTDGGLTFDDDGRLYQTFYVRDGFALKAAQRAGLKIAWVSGRKSSAVEKRAAELETDFCVLGCGDKFAALRDLQTQLGIMPGECCFIGDDLPDLPAFAACGLNIAVADAVAEVKKHADDITTAPGGRGAVREVIEHILRAQGRWEKLVEKFTRDEFDSDDHVAPENLQR